jgi:hypothetical protein
MRAPPLPKIYVVPAEGQMETNKSISKRLRGKGEEIEREGEGGDIIKEIRC